MSHDRHASSTTITPEESSLFVDILHEAPLYGHRKPTRILGSILYCILLSGYAIVAIAAPWIFLPIRRLIPPLLCSCNAVLLIITGIFQQYLVYQVQKVRLQGYYVFSQKLKHIIRLPFATVSYGTAAMLLVMVWEPHISILSPSVVLRIIMFVEVICAGSFISIYIGNVHQYNSLNSQPDVLKSLYSALQPSSSLEELRYHDGGRLSDQQMALLQYQRENLHYLSEEILRLQECLIKYERSDDGSTPQVDLVHLLAARDQELRALSAEMNQLQSELRLARNLIAERDSEIQRIRTTNNQYVEENERLRAILGEWSARAAKMVKLIYLYMNGSKLERALETEKMSNLELQQKISKLRNQPAESSKDRGT
ncbi:protein FIP1-like isoform X2 [Telopea speciosissima]|uniref:protein FIP1-like isoform X2 n=1 Tax=Telopea speciosissima TaxID=54955 RepID=UPI001CC6F6DB|nr:protein FIP1-like isoform X2 [Telopea speciosissima]